MTPLLLIVCRLPSCQRRLFCRTRGWRDISGRNTRSCSRSCRRSSRRRRSTWPRGPARRLRPCSAARGDEPQSRVRRGPASVVASATYAQVIFGFAGSEQSHVLPSFGQSFDTVLAFAPEPQVHVTCVLRGFVPSAATTRCATDTPPFTSVISTCTFDPSARLTSCFSMRRSGPQPRSAVYPPPERQLRILSAVGS